MRAFRRLGPVLALCLMGAACSSLNPFSKSHKRPCPRTEVLRDAIRAYVFRPGPGRDLSDLRYEVRLYNASYACSYSSDSVAVDLKVTIAARRGPADPDRKAGIRYFVAILDPSRRVLNKKVFDVDITFPINVDKGALTESLRQVIPLRRGESGAGYIVLTGLQLTKDELDYNRTQPSGPAGRLDRIPVTPGREPAPFTGPPERRHDENMRMPGTE